MEKKRSLRARLINASPTIFHPQLFPPNIACNTHTFLLCLPSYPISNPIEAEAGNRWWREAVHSLARVGSKKQKKEKRKSMPYPFNDLEAVMMCSRERER